MVKVNLADIEEKDFSAIPAGRYVIRFTDCSEEETKDREGNKLPPGTPYLHWECTVVRDFMTGDDKFANRKVWTNTIIHEKSLWSLKQLLRAIGWTDEQVNDPELDLEPSDCFDVECVAIVTERPYNGDTVNDVKSLWSIDAAQEKWGAKAGASGSRLP